MRRLEARLAEAQRATAAAEAAREAAELRLARIRAALLDTVAPPAEAERPALH